MPGRDFLNHLSRQVGSYDVARLSALATGACQADDGFEVSTKDAVVRSRTVIFATGIKDVRPDIDDHDGAVLQGLLRYCPVCDAFEVDGKRVGLLALEGHAEAKAAYLSRFTDRLDVHIVPSDQVVRLRRNEGGVQLHSGGDPWDTVYAMLGASPRSSLAAANGFGVNAPGCIIAGRHQEGALTGTYAIGDVVSGLDQITIAMAQAASAATHINNTLAR